MTTAVKLQEVLTNPEFLLIVPANNGYKDSINPGGSKEYRILAKFFHSGEAMYVRDLMAKDTNTAVDAKVISSLELHKVVIIT